MTIEIRCKGRHEVYATRLAAEANGVLSWAVRCVRGEDGKYHAFECEDDYREFKKYSPINYR